MSGENATIEADTPRVGGSSPRERGKLELLRRDFWDWGLIPALAAHPRVSGENLKIR